MSEKSKHGKKINLTIWITPDEMAELDAIVARKLKKAKVQYPGTQLTRHSLVYQIVMKFIKSQEVK